jgi:hypothetical protein
MKRGAVQAGAFLSALVIIAVGSALAYVMQKGTAKLPITQFYSPAYTNAVWDWANPLNRSPQAITETAEFLQSHQINTVYTDISIQQSLPTGTDKKELSELDRSLDTYIRIMHQHNIAVYAAAGDTDWSKPEQRRIPLTLLTYVQEFNGRHNNKFAGMQFDIESYNQAGFAEASMTEKSLVLMEFLDMVDQLAATTEQYITSSTDKKFGLGFSIPYWFDNENKNIESLSWHDKTGPVLYHLMDRLNQLPQSNVVVMAYRNAALGNDGIIYHSRTEIEYAQAQAKKVKVVIGVETTDVEPAKITFYGRTQTELSSEVALLTQEYQKSGVLGGIAINDLPGYEAINSNN